QPQSLEPLPTQGVPPEVLPLVTALNDLFERTARLLATEQQFTADAAHELRTPLSLLQGRASLSLERPRSPEQYREALAEISRTAEDLAQVIEALLLLARTQSPFEPE
ncbi:histidine kinase dimerization/phospho-acceptor domain-containing protein, partial [Acinetobacter baumannii]